MKPLLRLPVHRAFLAMIVLFCVCLPVHGTTLILPEAAIDDSARMSKEAFRDTYPGIDISNYEPDEEGYYVRYVHENLVYLFGPIQDYDQALEAMGRLMRIRDQVIAQAPSLASSSVDLVEFNFEDGVRQALGGTGSRHGRSPDSGVELGEVVSSDRLPGENPDTQDAAPPLDGPQMGQGGAIGVPPSSGSSQERGSRANEGQEGQQNQRQGGGEPANPLFEFLRRIFRF